MLRTCTLALLLCASFAVSAQTDAIIRGAVKDSAVNQPVEDATVTIMNATDSSLVSFTRTDKLGNFVLKGLTTGKYRLLITHVAFANFNFQISITAAVKVLDLGSLSLTPKSKLLAEVTVLQEVAPVTIRKDTIEYNAGSFKTRPNAVVEDLLKKLPGVQVDKDGKIKANGEEVKKVLVDGKEFFGNDPKTATKNLPSDIVDKVQVFDKKSEQSAFTGIDDGNSEKTINLTIKPDKKNGLFGRATVAAGTRSRYDAHVNLNQFKGDRQFSILSMTNNINKQGFTFTDILDFSGGMNAMGKGGMVNGNGLPVQGMNNPTGISRTTAGGMNFNDRWNKHTDITSSYFYNKIGNALQQQSVQQWLVPGNEFQTTRGLNSNKGNENHRANLVVDHRIDSMNSIRLTSSYNYQQGRSSSRNDYASVTGKSAVLNSGTSDADVDARGYNWNNSLLLRHRFSKKGRTISSTLSYNVNDATQSGSLYSLNSFYQDGNLQSSDTINQRHTVNGSGNTLQSITSYTEPLSKKSLIEAAYTYNINSQFSGKETFDFNSTTGKHTSVNDALTNAFDNKFFYHRGSLSLRTQQKKYNYTIGLALQRAQLDNDFKSHTDSSIARSYTNLLPNGNIEYEFNRYKNIRLFYNTMTRQPGITELQPVPDNTDPLNVKTGNPELQQEYTHSIRMNYHAFDPFRRTSLFAMLNMRIREHAIVYEDMLTSAGRRISRPVNVNGVYNLNGNLSWDFPIRLLKSSINLNTSVSRSRNIGFLNGAINRINNYGFTEEIRLTFLHKEIIDLVAGSSFSYNAVRYSLEGNGNIDYTTRSHSLEANLYLPAGFSIATDLDFVKRQGLSAGYNNQPLTWNAGLAKQLMKNKRAELRLQVFDILNQNAGISRTTNQNYIEDVSYNVLKRYFLLAFTYNISRFAGKSVPPSNRRDVQVIKM